MKRWDAVSVVLSRWWPLPAAAVVLVLQLYGWARAGRGVVAAARAAWPALRWIWPLLVAGLLIAWLHRPGVAATVAWLRRLPRAVAIGLLAAAALGLLVVVFVALPTWFVPDGAKVQDLYKARNDVRTTAVQATAGLVVLLGAYFTWRQLHTAREGQVTDRFTRAIDHLGSDQLDIRLGGIYALERIARDSKADRPTIAEVLTAYVRTHSPWPPSQPNQYKPDWPLDPQPDLRTRAPDVQAALTVLGRGRFASLAAMDSAWLDLQEVDLRKANLAGAHLERANLAGAHLEGANLSGAHLERARLAHAHLKRANLSGAHLEGAILNGAHLERAYLNGAYLKGALFLEHAHLAGAEADGTLWPDGFDWQAAGVDFVYTVE
jgi:hypothetical protein